MTKLDIQVSAVSPKPMDDDKPVRLTFAPAPPLEWETLLFERWIEGKEKIARYPDMNITEGLVTLACRWGDYRQFFHEELEKKIAEANDLYNKQAEEAALQKAEEEKAALVQPSGGDEEARERLRQMHAVYQLQHAGAPVPEEQQRELALEIRP